MGMHRSFRAGFVSAAASLFLAPVALAAANASDNAGNSAYNSGWAAGSNGGVGFGPWSFVAPASGGITLGNSSSNGAGDATGDINTPKNVSGRAWELYADTGSIAAATRGFSSPMTPGQVFSFDMDNGLMNPANPDAVSAVDLSNAGDVATVWSFGSQTGRANYYVSDTPSSRRDTGIPTTDAGVHVDFLLTSDTTYSASITPTGSATTIVTGSLINLADHSLQNVDLVAFGTGSAAANRAYFNSIAITTPEPGSVGAAALACLGLLRRRRRAHA
jgi:hypothetical protein